ncbi:hypothetical protein SAMD00019534_020600, partial [Acytostelium subglobosum LB1]|uniref:hypothetical protein n=1 Tax=Acytostelium subglobosum LB1 TaxID=1410327 RepID=UPI00064516AF
LIIVILVLFALSTPSLCDIWSSCGSPTDHFQIQNVTITPDPPVAGQSLNVTASGYLDEDVVGGYAHILIKYGIIPIIVDNQDLCSFPKSPYHCPIISGEYERSVVGVIPADAPPGQYFGNISFTDMNNQEIACILFNITL